MTLLERLRAMPPGSLVPAAWVVTELEAALEAPALHTSANGPRSADDQLLTVQEVAERFGLTRDWLYRHWKTVGGVKLGRKVLRFPAAALPRYLATRRKAGAT